MDNLRFFEIYRSSEYLGLLFDGILISAGLTIAAGLLGVALALILASIRYWQVPVIGGLLLPTLTLSGTPRSLFSYFLSRSGYPRRLAIPAILGSRLTRPND